jgi:hypothetical protein
MSCIAVWLMVSDVDIGPPAAPSPPPAAQAAPAPQDAPAVGQQGTEAIDFARARQLLLKRQRGEPLTAEEQAYLLRAVEARRRGQPPRVAPQAPLRDTSQLRPLTEMSADDRYQDQEGGLYGQGRNTPPDEHRAAALRALAEVAPRDAQGRVDPQGQIVLISISMSNATQEFSTFKRMADADAERSPRVRIVDCAQGGQAMAEWASPEAPPWREAARRLEAAGVTPAQVQVAWVKLANKSPRGQLHEHGKKLQEDTLRVVQIAKQRFPNLQVVYLSSRIYGGYAIGSLNPEPYAYESAYAARWLIQQQMAGDEQLNYDPARGPVKAPVLLWGPYLWANGTTARKEDGLVWRREDFVGDGVHPSSSGREKVAKLLLRFFKEDPLARGWFVAAGDR